MRRTLSLTLCASLLGGLLPDPAAAARIVASAAPNAGVPVAAIVPVTAVMSAPGVTLTGPAGLGAVSPAVSLPAVRAPAAASAAQAAQAAAARLDAPAAALPAPHAAAFTAAPAEGPIVPLAATPQADRQAFTRTVSAVRTFVAAASPARLARMDSGHARLAAGHVFDRSGANDDDFNAVRAPALLTRPLSWTARTAARLVAVSPLGRLLPAAVAERWGRAPPPAPVRTAFSRDDFGGPQPLKAVSEEGGRLRRWTRRAARDLGYGLKWGVTMTGLASLIEVTVKPLAAAAQWQLWIPQGMLKYFGRVELLTGMGPGDIAEAVADAPGRFFGLTLPGAVLHEELAYRVLNFGITFLLLACIRPVAQRLSKLLDEVPDLFGLRSAAQWVLKKAAGVSGRAFGMAATLSAASFAAAHFAAWGIAPATFAQHLSLGLALAWVAYRSRGLLAPAAAHFAYNAIAIGLAIALPVLVLPQTAALTGVLVGIFTGVFAWYQWRSWKKGKAAAEAAARGEAPRVLSLWARARRWGAVLLMPLALVASFLVMPNRWDPALTAPPAKPPTAVTVTHPATLTAPTPARTAPPAVMTYEQLVKAVKPAVVMVLTPTGSGSGFIVSPDGLLVTNSHVVGLGEHVEDPLANAYAPFVKIRFANGREVPAKVVGYHAAKDIALIQLPPNPFGWPSVSLGDSNALAEGQEIAAMGYPRGLPFTVTRGIVSGTQMRSNGFVHYIQHDASVNPGNSGGPMFDLRGQVVGINSMIITQSGGFDGISYAISAADLQKALDQYAKVGNISAAWLGAIFSPSEPGAEFGARVDAVRPGSPAAQAGLRAGDIVIGLDGMSFADDADEAFKALTLGLRGKMPTEKVQLQVYRAGGVVEVPVTLGAR